MSYQSFDYYSDLTGNGLVLWKVVVGKWSLVVGGRTWRLDCTFFHEYRKMPVINPGLVQLRKVFFGWQGFFWIASKNIMINKRYFS